MKKLSTQAFEEVRLWIYRNSRQIELSTWLYEFENGSMEAVLSALSIYQNQDGGFGNALEPDNWNPDSTPYVTLTAIEKLNEINYCAKSHPIITGILRFLGSGMHSDENGWLFNIPSNDDWPHAPWWTYDPDANTYESIGVTAGIASFVLTFAESDSELYQRAFSIADRLINMLKEPHNFGDMGVTGYVRLYDTINKLCLADKFDMYVFSNSLNELVNSKIERDISKWPSYGYRPSAFIQSPDSLFYKSNEEIIHKELDYLIDTRPKNGVWGITWTWFDNNDKYPKEFAISENWWKAGRAISTLKLLRDFDRLEWELPHLLL